MVRFGEKLEAAKQKKWADEYLDYERLKQLLTMTVRALERNTGGISHVGVSNFAPSGGLLCSGGGAPGRFETLSKAESERLRSAFESKNYFDECHWSQQFFGVKLSFPALLQAFDVALACELQKVRRFYARQVEQLRTRWAHHVNEDLPGRRREASPSPVEEVSLKRALSQLHDDASLLKDFSAWNCAALHKITKKRDKLFRSEPPIKADVCSSSPFLTFQRATECRDLLRSIRDEFAAIFCDEDAAEADWQLREVLKEDERTFYSREAMRLGYRAGVAAMLAVWVLWDCVEVVDGDSKHRESVASKPAWPVFRACGELVAWHWMWGLCLHCWSVHRVNVDFLFDCDSGTPSAFEVYDEAAMETIVLLALLLVYYKATYHDGLPRCVARYVEPRLVAAYAPAVTASFCVYRLVTPWARRQHLWRALGRVVAAPCVPVKFVDTYVADVLSSVVKILLDALWTVCFFGTGDFVVAPTRHPLLTSCAASLVYSRIVAPLVCLLPVWFRFAQCLRKHHDLSGGDRLHLLNAAKYALSLFVSLSSALQRLGGPADFSRLWLVIFCISSFYSWAWDVAVDWGLPSLLRGKRARMYPSKLWYPLALVFDLGGRFVWLATLLPPSAVAKRLDRYIPEYLVPMLALVELARRCVWGLFRLEHEHVSNAFHNRPDGQFVPSHFKRAKPHAAAPTRARRLQSSVETLAIAALVVTLLVRIAVSAGDADAAAHRSHTSDDDDDALFVPPTSTTIYDAAATTTNLADAGASRPPSR